MATAKSGTCPTGSAVTVTVDVSPFGNSKGINVTNTGDGSNAIWVRTDGTAAAANADNCYPVFGNATFATADGASSASISLFCAAAGVTYTVASGLL